jgi:hypothetical protein
MQCPRSAGERDGEWASRLNGCRRGTMLAVDVRNRPSSRLVRRRSRIAHTRDLRTSDRMKTPAGRRRGCLLKADGSDRRATNPQLLGSKRIVYARGALSLTGGPARRGRRSSSFRLRPLPGGHDLGLHKLHRERLAKTSVLKENKPQQQGRCDHAEGDKLLAKHLPPWADDAGGIARTGYPLGPVGAASIPGSRRSSKRLAYFAGEPCSH